MMEDDRGDAAQAFTASQNLGADARMLAHEGVLFLGQTGPTQEDAVGQGDLSQVVNMCGHVDLGQLRFGKAQQPAEVFRHVPHPQRVLGGMGVAGFDCAYDALHQVVIERFVQGSLLSGGCGGRR